MSYYINNCRTSLTLSDEKLTKDTRRELNSKCVRYILTISVGLNHSARKTSAAIEERSKFSVRTVLTFGNNGKELRLKSVVSYKNVTISKRIKLKGTRH